MTVVGILDDPLDPSAIENLRRSVAMLTPGQAASIERERALALLGEIQRLQRVHTSVIDELRELLDRIVPTDSHPSRAAGRHRGG